MRDASVILIPIYLWQAGVFAAVAYRLAAGAAPMTPARRWGLSLAVFAVPVLLLHFAKLGDFASRQLWLAGGYNLSAKLPPPYAMYDEWSALVILASAAAAIEFTRRWLCGKLPAGFLPLLLAVIVWLAMLGCIAAFFPDSRKYFLLSLLLLVIILILEVAPVAIVFGFWSDIPKVAYYSMAIFIEWQLFWGMLGYLASFDTFVHYLIWAD